MLFEDNISILQKLNQFITERNAHIKKIKNMVQHINEINDDLSYIKIYGTTLNQFEKKESQRREQEIQLFKSIQISYNISNQEKLYLQTMTQNLFQQPQKLQLKLDKSPKQQDANIQQSELFNTIMTSKDGNAFYAQVKKNINQSRLLLSESITKAKTAILNRLSINQTPFNKQIFPAIKQPFIEIKQTIPNPNPNPNPIKTIAQNLNDQIKLEYSTIQIEQFIQDKKEQPSDIKKWRDSLSSIQDLQWDQMINHQFLCRIKYKNDPENYCKKIFLINKIVLEKSCNNFHIWNNLLYFNLEIKKTINQWLKIQNQIQDLNQKQNVNKKKIYQIHEYYQNKKKKKVLKKIIRRISQKDENLTQINFVDKKKRVYSSSNKTCLISQQMEDNYKEQKEYRSKQVSPKQKGYQLCKIVNVDFKNIQIHEKPLLQKENFRSKSNQKEYKRNSLERDDYIKQLLVFENEMKIGNRNSLSYYEE